MSLLKPHLKMVFAACHVFSKLFSLPYMAIISVIPLYGTLRGEAVKEFKAVEL